MSATCWRVSARPAGAGYGRWRPAGAVIGCKRPDEAVGSDLLGDVRPLEERPEEGTRVLDSTKQRAVKQAGIDTAMHHIKGYSGDTALRSPIMAPWPIYPFSPIDCAGLICDLLLFETTVSADALVGSLEGLD